MRIGRHIPTNPTPLKVIQRAQQLGCEAIQIFVSNPTGWKYPEEDVAKSAIFAESLGESGLHPLVIHAPYLINLASPDDVVWNKSLGLLGWTLRHAALIGANSVVFHTGSHRGTGIESGIIRIAEGIKHLLSEKTVDVMLLLENDVGAGNSLGGKFEHLRDVLNMVSDYQDQVGVCLDTAHLWGAGYDLSSINSTLQIMQRFDRLIGLARLKVIHLNDTEVARGSHRDIHARIGEGIISRESFQTLLCDPRLSHCAVLLETPVQINTDGKEDWEHERQHIERVKSLAIQMSASFASTEDSFATLFLDNEAEEAIQQSLW